MAMLNADYFNEDVVTQVNELGSGSCSLEIHLHGGCYFKVRALGKVATAYVLLEVFPEEGVTEESKSARRKLGGTDEVFYDRVAVPYSSIAYVLMTVKESAREEPFGFQPRSVPA